MANSSTLLQIYMQPFNSKPLAEEVLYLANLIASNYKDD